MKELTETIKVAGKGIALFVLSIIALLFKMLHFVSLGFAFISDNPYKMASRGVSKIRKSLSVRRPSLTVINGKKK